MTTTFHLASRALGRDEAERLADHLQGALGPEAAVTGTLEVDEAGERWIAEAWYEGEPDTAALAAVLAGAGFAACDVTVVPLADIDWVRRSLEGLAPVAAGRFFVHGGHDRHRRPAGGIAIEVDAGTAFGTGHHGSTRGCLEALDCLLRRVRPASILDVGCGTGVLAIAAAKALHVPAIASDIDPEAVRVAAANARRNGAGPWVRTVTAAGLSAPAIRRHGPYDLVFANILARPLVALAPAIVAATARLGHVVLAGLTRDQERQVLAAYRARGLVAAFRIRQEHWSTLVLKRPARQCRA
jgi:ribosomal protein L11 methyltransferase